MSNDQSQFTGVIAQEMTGAAVNDFITDVLQPVVRGAPVALFSAAALTLILCSLRPDIEDVELVEGLRDISAHIVLWVSALDARTSAEAGEPVGRPN